MGKLTIKDIKEKNLILYEYVRGSHSHGIATEKSDIDIGGVFIAPEEMYYGLSSNYQSQVSDEKNDVVYYEIGKWFELLLKSNPTALESLFIPEHCIKYIHPLIQEVINNRDIFISKSAFEPLIGYSISQIKKCRGLNKKINWEIPERKNILEFCYIPWKQGSIPLKKFLEDYGLRQEFCGLVAIPNMRDMYHVFYDWGAHKQNIDGNDNLEHIDIKRKFVISAEELGAIAEPLSWFWVYNNIPTLNEVLNYRGICNPNDYSKSNEVRLSSIPKGATPICQMSFNKDGYSSHCIKYREYKEWEKHRNPIRYESNLKKSYDAKNVGECIRLIHMGIELAKGEGFNVYRTWDRDFLLDVRNHKYEYEYIIEYTESKQKEMEKAISESILPDNVDIDMVNNLLINVRRKFYGGE